ncbi:MAG: shikimate kinase [Planctomycetaceae bacterium]|nr:MAG: shikimate kinase [Planctomycetaceae bacterium]
MLMTQPTESSERRPTKSWRLPAHCEGKHIYLTGYRGSGKSSVGRILAKRTGLPWIDLDDEIERETGRAIREIFADGGESTFRDIEQQSLRRVSELPPHVVSLGGGAVLRPANRQRIRDTGICVWLHVDARTALRRLGRDRSTSSRRPALTNLPLKGEIETLLAQREPLYREAANHRIETRSQRVTAIARQVFEAISQPAGPKRPRRPAGPPPS